MSCLGEEEDEIKLSFYRLEARSEDVDKKRLADGVFEHLKSVAFGLAGNMQKVKIDERGGNCLGNKLKLLDGDGLHSIMKYPETGLDFLCTVYGMELEEAFDTPLETVNNIAKRFEEL